MVILGAFLGVFALHGLSVQHDQTDPAPAVAVAVAVDVAPQLESHAVSEALEQVAMLAPVLVADWPSHHVTPCAAVLAGSLLLLSAWLVLRRQRFGDEPRRFAIRYAQLPCRPSRATGPQLAKLCILRT